MLRFSNFGPMYYVRLMCLLLSATCFIFLIAGLFKPWIMLWFEDIQNRKKIIQVYGSLTVFFLIAYGVLKIF
jgi:hypothetical protein